MGRVWLMGVLYIMVLFLVLFLEWSCVKMVQYCNGQCCRSIEFLDPA